MMETWSFTERELRLIKNSIDYANGDPAGLPGHNLMIIISKMWDLLSTVPLTKEVVMVGNSETVTVESVIAEIGRQMTRP